MAVTYFKRFRMELRLDGSTDGSLAIPPNVELLPWSPRLANSHALTKWNSFREELDAFVFPCLAELEGCQHLMREISSRKDFVPEATWLACRRNEFEQSTDRSIASRVSTELAGLQPIGTIQGLRPSGHEGAIQNLGVVPEFRDLGLGSILLRAALNGFREVGCRYVHLEVTVQNTAAIRLYERFGFRKVETLFKVADVQYA